MENPVYEENRKPSKFTKRKKQRKQKKAKINNSLKIPNDKTILENEIILDFDLFLSTLYKNEPEVEESTMKNKITKRQKKETQIKAFKKVK